uniref:Uncharacterized protein n=1 Tax=Brassica oleracea var. oleracea TaxID=109376 RepID=A0A0D3DR33_BRAOL
MFADDKWSSDDGYLKVDGTSELPCVFYLQEWSFFKPPREVFELTFHREDEDPAPAMGSSATVGYLLLLELLCFDSPPELLFFLDPLPELLFF